MTFSQTQSTNSQLRTLLILGRVSNLPTVWSNCLAGWIMGAAANSEGWRFSVQGRHSFIQGGCT